MSGDCNIKESPQTGLLEEGNCRFTRCRAQICLNFLIDGLKTSHPGFVLTLSHQTLWRCNETRIGLPKRKSLGGNIAIAKPGSHPSISCLKSLFICACHRINCPSLEQIRGGEHEIDKACLQPRTAVVCDLTLKLGCGSEQIVGTTRLKV